MLRWNKGGKDAAASEASPAAGESRSPGARPPSGPFGRSLAELLLAEGRVNEAQLERALTRQKETGAFLGEILIEQGIIDEKSLLSFLTKHCKIPHLSLLDYLIDKSLMDLIPKEICLKHRLLPIDQLGRNLTVAMVNPLDIEALEVVRRQCPELRIKPILCAYNHFEIVTNRLFNEGAGKKVELSASSLGLRMPKSEIPTLDPDPPTPSTTPEPVPEPGLEPAPEATRPLEQNLAPLEEKASEEWPDAEEVAEAVSSDEAAAAMRNDACISEVFREDLEEIADTEGSAGAAPEGETETAGSALMKEMASVMMDSMRDTYGVLARRMELFRGLAPEEVARIFAGGATVEFEEGDVIFAKDAPGESMFVVLGGEIAIEDEGRELAVLGRGDMFGEMALLSDAPRSAGARAKTYASCLELSKDLVQGMGNPELTNKLLLNIIATLSQRIRDLNAQSGG